MGASTVKWTTLDPCTCLSENGSKQYTNFEFCGKNIISILKHIDLQNKQFLLTKKNLTKSLFILEDGASGDIEQVIVKFMFKT